MCIPIVLASTLYYQFSMNRMKQQIEAKSHSSLVIMKNRAERILQGIEQNSLQLAKDPELSDLLGKPYSAQNLFLHQEFLDKISLVKNTNSFIDEIFLYNGSEDLVLSNRYGAVAKSDYKYKDDIERLIKESRFSTWRYMPAGVKDGYITFARNLPVIGGGGPQGVLAFEIETAAISKFLESNTVILTKGQGLIAVNYEKPFDSQRTAISSEWFSGSRAIEMIEASDKSEDTFIAEGIDGKKAQYSYLKNVFGRTYVSVIPESVITGQLNWIRGGTVLVLLAFLGLGIILTWLNLKRAYNPIEQLMKHSRAVSVDRIPKKENEFEYIKECIDFLSKEREYLGSCMERVEPTLREKCLLQLFNGDYARNETLIQDCASYGISVQSASVVLIVEAENIYKERRFLPEEKGVVAFALANVMQELLHAVPCLRGYVIPFEGRGAALLQFNPDTVQKTMLQQTIEYAHSVCEALKNYLSFVASVGIGRFYTHIADVPVSYKEADIALQYRIYRDSDPVLFIEDLEQAKKQTTLRYPRDLEGAVVEYLEKGDLPSAAQSLKQYSEILKYSQSYEFVYQSYHVLLSSIISSLDKQGGNILDMMEHNLFGQLKRKQTSREIYAWFEETVFPLYIWLTKNIQEAAGQSAIQHICKYIKENCGENLSLVQCSGIVGMSPSYLSRLFKKEMGMNFLEYVVECKVAEAKRMLADTDHTVSDIATAIGYSERNMNRIFQRYALMTPSQYRAKYRW
jgi:AraC-like DNA-binding protein